MRIIYRLVRTARVRDHFWTSALTADERIALERGSAQ